MCSQWLNPGVCCRGREGGEGGDRKSEGKNSPPEHHLWKREPLQLPLSGSSVHGFGEKERGGKETEFLLGVGGALCVSDLVTLCPLSLMVLHSESWVWSKREPGREVCLYAVWFL